jgi:hypothetical protein
MSRLNWKRWLWVLLLLPGLVWGYKVESKKWEQGYTFGEFLSENHIPIDLYYSLPNTIKRMLLAIPTGETYFILRDGKKVKQALIPLNKEKQLQIIWRNGKYIAKVVPIHYDVEVEKVDTTIHNSLSYDLYQKAHTNRLALQIEKIFKHKIDFYKMPENTHLVVVYEVKKRFGEIRDVKVLYANISSKYYNQYAFLNPIDGRYYDQEGRSLKGEMIVSPLAHYKITSPFGMRYHPILHRWRMHEGVDLVWKVGAPVRAVASGRVIFKGWLGGYGKAVKIKHRGGYITLYAHLRGWAHIHKGSYVHAGQVIGYLGNTGLSTGPHLHFGVMYHHRWINPFRFKGKEAKYVLKGRAKKRYMAYIRRFIKEYNLAVNFKKLKKSSIQ